MNVSIQQLSGQWQKEHSIQTQITKDNKHDIYEHKHSANNNDHDHIYKPVSNPVDYKRKSTTHQTRLTKDNKHVSMKQTQTNKQEII